MTTIICDYNGIDRKLSVQQVCPIPLKGDEIIRIAELISDSGNRELYGGYNLLCNAFAIYLIKSDPWNSIGIGFVYSCTVRQLKKKPHY